MFSEERKEKILELVNRKKTVKVSELSEVLKTSEVTIRRDLDELHSEQKLCRTHGGAMVLRHERNDLPLRELCVRQVEEKKKIAKVAFRYICDNDVILMDDSTTVQELARLVAKADFENLTVVTVSIPVVNILLTNENLNVVMIGGPITRCTNAVLGTMAERMLKDFRIDKCFIGINGIESEGIYTTSNFLEMTTKQVMLDVSRQKFILADHTKFGQTSFLKVEEGESKIDCLITDCRLEDFDYSIISKTTSVEFGE